MTLIFYFINATKGLDDKRQKSVDISSGLEKVWPINIIRHKRARVKIAATFSLLWAINRSPSPLDAPGKIMQDKNSNMKCFNSL